MGWKLEQRQLDPIGPRRKAQIDFGANTIQNGETQLTQVYPKIPSNITKYNYFKIEFTINKD